MFHTIKHCFVINPCAGKGQESGPLAEKIRDACAAGSAEYEIYLTKAPGDATRFVKERIARKASDECLRFYACGGDGTLGEVVGGAVDESFGGPIPGVQIGCIPIGTGNDFIRNFTHPTFFCDITKQLLGDPITVDCYAINDRYGLNMVNTGVDCDAAAKAAELKKHPLMPKSLAYFGGVASVLKKNLGKVIRVVRSDGSAIGREFELCAVANGGYCGGGFFSAPLSCLDDGLLDISLIRKVSRLTFLRLVFSYRKGTHLKTRIGKKVVSYIQDTAITFQFEKEETVCVDGEIITMKEARFRVVPRALSFVVPVGSVCRSLSAAQETSIDDL